MVQLFSMKKDKRFSIIYFAAIFLCIPLFISICVSCYYNSNNSSNSTHISAMNVTLDELVNAYRENRVSADVKYKNKNITITGKVANVFPNPARISFEVGLENFPIDDFLQRGLLGSIYSIVMVFDKQYINKVSNYRSGDIISVEGKFMGLNEFNNLQMNNCKIVDTHIDNESPNVYTFNDILNIYGVSYSNENQYYINTPTGRMLNVRTDPSLNSDIIHMLENFSNVYIIKEESNIVNVDGVNGKWVFIVCLELNLNVWLEGWVFGGFLTPHYENYQTTNSPSNQNINSQSNVIQTTKSNKYVEPCCPGFGTTRCITFQREYEEAIADYDVTHPTLPPGLVLPNGRTVREVMESNNN